MPPFRATPAITTLRTAGTSSVGLFPRPSAAVSPHPAAVTLCVQRQNFFLPALQQRFASIGGSNFTNPTTRKHSSTSASSAIDEMVDADIDISDPPEAVGASHAATAKAAREKKGWQGDDIQGGNKMLYASAGALGVLGLYAVMKENPEITPSGGSSSSSSRRTSNPELDPGTDARGRTHPLSSVKQSRQHHDLPAHAPGGETIEFKLGRG